MQASLGPADETPRLFDGAVARLRRLAASPAVCELVTLPLQYSSTPAIPVAQKVRRPEGLVVLRVF